MSDLHCPATLLVTRHGDADYGHPSVLSDEGGWLSERGREQADALAESLRVRNVARVFTSPMQRAVETAAQVARVLGTDVVEVPDLQAQDLSAYARLTDVALRTRQEPARGLYIAESAAVIERAIGAGHRPISFLMAPKWLALLCMAISSMCCRATGRFN